MIREAIKIVIEGQSLTLDESSQCMTEIMDGLATPAQIAALLVALRLKGESIEELTGFARIMRAKATPVPHTRALVVDTCGTGGDSSGTFNISTTAAFVVAGAGVAVAKHGNRALSSQSGSADVLGALGVKLDLTPERVGLAIDKVGIGFLFAPALHGAMKHAAGPRKEIGVRTAFNLLGPLTNPAGAKHQVIGVFDADYVELLAAVLGQLGCEHALVVHGDGLDELTVCGESRVAELKDGKIRGYYVDPEEYGFELADAKALAGGDAALNASITRAVLEGASGAKRDIVLLNAAAALVAANACPTLREGVAMATHAIDSGGAAKKLDALIEFSNA